MTAADQPTMQEAALSYASSGWPVFPLVPGEKRPATAHGCKDASTDTATVRAWWERTPSANIGFALPADLMVIDVDTKGADGHASLAELAAPHGGMPETLTAESPTGGLHLVYRKPPDVRVKNRVGIAPGIDTREAGGYIVVAPSTIGGVPYRWRNNAAPADCPAWLLKLLTADPKGKNTARPASFPAPAPQGARPADNYAQRAMERATSEVLKAPEGTRNDALNGAGYGLARLAAAGRLDWNHAALVLTRAALAAGLDPDEVGRTLESAGRAGQASPNYEGMPGNASAPAALLCAPTAQPLDESALRDEHRKLWAAMQAIPRDATQGKHAAGPLLGMALRHTESAIPEGVGLALCRAWDEKTGGQSAKEFLQSAPDYSATRPLTVASVFKLAIAQGWKPETPPHEWGEPIPLPDALPPVAPFDPELLPEALRGWVMDIAERMQCPPDFTAVGAVTALSSLIGARAVVAPKQQDDWRVVPNLWGLVVGRPGVMKSPALGEVLKPLHRLESAEREQWQAAHEAWELDNKVAELAGKANEKQAASLAAKDPAKARALLAPVDTPAEPTMRRYVVNDSTMEALADLLVTNPWGVLVYRDEVHGLLCSMDRQGQEGARGFYLTGYDGNQGYAVDRILRGHSYVPRVCMAMLGGIQPGKVQSYVREAVNGGAGDDGLLQRFGLAVWPDVHQEFKLVDRWPDTPAKQATWAVFERLNQLQPATDDEPQEWRFSPEAQAIFYDWLVPFETGIRGDDLHPALVSHLAKWRKLIPALALIFALLDTPDSGNVIHERELVRALAWGEYLRTHAERLYAAALVPETTGAHALLAKIKGGKLCDGDGVLWESFTPRLVAVKHWAGLGTPDAVRKASDLLADYGWLARDTVQSGDAMGRGRPSDRYLIHPALLAPHDMGQP